MFVRQARTNPKVELLKGDFWVSSSLTRKH
jgi:hypothetical protein